MKTYTANEIQAISAEFRQIARRLSRTDHDQCDANLLRFLAFVEKTPLVYDFINENNTITYDISKICKERDWLDPFSISPNKSEEISFEYQLLIYAKTELEGDFTSLYGTYYYTRAESTVNDEMRTFISHIIDPLIDHICEYLQVCYIETMREEETNQKEQLPSLTANNSTIVIGSSIEGGIKNNVVENIDNRDDIEETFKKLRALLITLSNEKSEEILEVLETIEDSVSKNEKPKKGFLTALQTLSQFIPQIIPLVTLLINQISK